MENRWKAQWQSGKALLLGAALGVVGCHRPSGPPPTTSAQSLKSPPGQNVEQHAGGAAREKAPGRPSVEMSPPVSIGGKTGNRKGDGKDKECIDCMTSHRKPPLG